MSTHRVSVVLGVVLIGGVGCDALLTRSDSAALTGGIFTTDRDGNRVNQNIFEHKEDVYLDGGPGDGAPPGSGTLPEGDYYFQVTDPSGHTLLSTDDLSCRSFHISEDGVIDEAYAGADGCMHATGVDQDHAELGAITIQLMPYADTPNPGGEYKVWVTAVGDYDAGGGGSHGFLPQHSKTDNFKVLTPDEEPMPDAMPPDEPAPDAGEEPPAPVCPNGIVEPGEQCDDGNFDDTDGCTSQCIVNT
jgi:cysteine-rich repeat protein